MTDSREVVSALVDGERVDPDAIAAALEVPANRTLLVDFLRLRHSLGDADAAPEWVVHAAVPAEGSGERRRRAWMSIAAALALLTVGALGGTWLERTVTREQPPEPARIVQLQVVDGR